MSFLNSFGNSPRSVKFASVGLAVLVSGLSTGCSSSTAARFLKPSVDTDWQTASTYASATSSMPPRSIVSVGHSTHSRECSGTCTVRLAAGHARPSHRRM